MRALINFIKANIKLHAGRHSTGKCLQRVWIDLKNKGTHTKNSLDFIAFSLTLKVLEPKAFNFLKFVFSVSTSFRHTTNVDSFFSFHQVNPFSSTLFAIKIVTSSNQKKKFIHFILFSSQPRTQPAATDHLVVVSSWWRLSENYTQHNSLEAPVDSQMVHRLAKQWLIEVRRAIQNGFEYTISEWDVVTMIRANGGTIGPILCTWELQQHKRIKVIIKALEIFYVFSLVQLLLFGHLIACLLSSFLLSIKARYQWWLLLSEYYTAL